MVQLGRRSFSGLIFDVFNYTFLSIVAFIMVFPFIYIVSDSLSIPDKLTGGLVLFPQGFTLRSYAAAFSDPTIFHSILISISRTIVGPIVMVFVTSMAAYCLSRNDLIAVRFWRKFFIITMYFSSGLIPLYVLIVDLHLAHTFFVYVIPSALNVFNMILIKTYIESLPSSMEEAAIMDGANDFVIWWKVMFPVCMPIMAAVVLFAAVGQWNSFIDTQLYNTMNTGLYTLQYVLYQTLNSDNINFMNFTATGTTTANTMVTPEALQMAITIITVAPIAIVYPFFQRFFVKGLLVGSIKG